MNYRRGFFRIWAVFAALWLIVMGTFAFGSLQSAYEEATTRATFDFKDAAGRSITVISPSHYSAQEYIGDILKPGAGLQAPDCASPQSGCKPSDREWNGLKLLDGASVGPDRMIIGPFSIEDTPGFEAAKEALHTMIRLWAVVCLGVPFAVGVAMAAIGWAARGFRAS